MGAKPKNSDKNPERDELFTPAYAVEPLLPYLPKNSLIWEPAAGQGHLVDALEISGYRVVASTLATGQDYFNYEPDSWDMMVTNPPYTLKYPWLERAYLFGKPFALLLPADTLFAASSQCWFKRFGYQMLLPSQRVDYKTPKLGWNSSAQFTSAWFCWGLPDLAQGVNFVKLNKPKRRRGHIPTDAEMVRLPSRDEPEQLVLF